MKRFGWLIAIVGIVLLNVAVHFCVVRWDMTDDHRYSLSQPTKKLLSGLEQPLEVTLYLTGDLNSGFRRLKTAAMELVEELGIYARVDCRTFDAETEKIPEQLSPIVIHERQKDGKTAQTTVYPYAGIRYGNRSAIVSLRMILPEATTT